MQLRERVLHTVAKHIEGAQRVGVFWSGGVDSTVMLGALKILGVPERQTFTVGFRDDPTEKSLLSADLYWTERTAQGLATTHHPIVIDQAHKPDVLLPRILRQLNEPLLTPSPYLKFLLAEAAYRNGLNSCVDGDWGESLARRFSKKKLQKMYKAVGNDASVQELFLFRRMGKAFSFDEQMRLLVDPAENPREMVLHTLNRYRQRIEADNVSDLLSGMSMQVMLYKGTVGREYVSVLHGVEVRSPFLDIPLLEFANRIPTRFKGSESDDMTKALFRRAFKDVLPEELANRKKVGHPSYSWSRGEIDALKRRLLSPAGLERTGLFRPDAVQSVLEADTPSTSKSAGKRTWGLLVMQAWFELYVNGNEDFFTDPKEPSA